MEYDSHETRTARALLALDGLSVGDALGERCAYLPALERRRLAREGQFPTKGWRYTDDTVMAMGIVEVLHRRGYIDQDELAEVFARRFDAEPNRGYGPSTLQILSGIDEGLPWLNLASAVFSGQGSFGNGGAMRVAPLGAWFADDVDRLVVEANRSAEVTHTHAEGMAGALAVALAAAFAWNRRGPDDAGALLPFVLARLPAGEVKRGLETARDIPRDALPGGAALQLGNGSEVTAADTVPFALWCAARHLGDYEAALRSAIEVGGDIDTVCAIVGGVVSLSAPGGIRRDWLAAREPLQLGLVNRPE
jgi:ADP-ribosylglycohydrolase